MKNKVLFLQLISLAAAIFVAMPSIAQSESVVNLAGNAYITSGDTASIDERNNAVRNWSDKESVISFYFKAKESGNMNIALQAKGNSRIEVSLLGKKKKVTLNSNTLSRIDLGVFKVDKPEYIKLDIRGIKIIDGIDFGNIAAVIVGGDVSPVVRVTPDFSSHFGRRGPSVHLRYDLPDENTEWFYNEIVVPEEGDIPGSYYMACGFGEGYFGIQNNSPKPRRVLFSVWSPYKTDNAAEIPDSMRVTLVKKGADVKVQDFGNEGSGGQSYMHYDWKAGERCRFLMGARPDGQGNTVYTAYFYDNTKSKWKLVASFRRPKTNTWYTNAYSFLENFYPTMGYINRKAYYGNQWARTADGRWIPITKARFTCDTTGRQEMRQDYTGGTDGGQFFLSMGGFFNDYMEYGTYFDRTGNTTEAPDIDFSTLE